MCTVLLQLPWKPSSHSYDRKQLVQNYQGPPSQVLQTCEQDGY